MSRTVQGYWDELGKFIRQSFTGRSADVYIKGAEALENQEIYELLETEAIAATVTSNTWIPTKHLIDGLMHWSTSAAQTGNITVYYSFDGITAVNSAVLQALGGVGAENHAFEFSDLEGGADAAGFARNIKRYPFVTFGLASGAGTGTMECQVSVVRKNG